MSSLRRLFRSACSRSGKGGFTLVELLVVIAIIALLAAVAMGPITGAMRTAKDNAGMQTTHALYVADFQYNIDNNNFADGADAGAIAQNLLNGGYISDPSIFFIAGGSTTKFTGSNAAQGITAQNVSWDFLGSGATYTGLTTSDPEQLPLVWSTGNTITIPAAAGSYGTATVNANGKNAYGTDGIPVAYLSGASSFKKVSNITTLSITQFIDDSYTPPTTSDYVVRFGSH
jgi:prepilin-type N-terminal cleavage/methylation domain-containing protein